MKKLIPILQILIYINYLAEFSPFLLCLFFFKKIKTAELKVFFLYSIFYAFFLCLSIYFRIFLKNGSLQLIVNRVFLVSEFIFLSVFYHYCIEKKFSKWIFLLSAIFFLLFSFFDYYTSKKGVFSFIPLVIECLFFLVVIIYFFYEKLQNDLYTSIYYYPSFWISVGFLIYFSGNFFLFLFSRTMYSNPSFKVQFTIVYNFVAIIKNIFICTAILVNAKTDYTKHDPNKPIEIDLDSFILPINKNNNL